MFLILTNFNLFEFSATILEKGLLTGCEDHNIIILHAGLTI